MHTVLLYWNPGGGDGVLGSIFAGYDCVYGLPH